MASNKTFDESKPTYKPSTCILPGPPSTFLSGKRMNIRNPNQRDTTELRPLVSIGEKTVKKHRHCFGRRQRDMVFFLQPTRLVIKIDH
jgi:hypothetical protein